MMFFGLDYDQGPFQGMLNHKDYYIQPKIAQ